jgi:hypothetical protein
MIAKNFVSVTWRRLVMPNPNPALGQFDADMLRVLRYHRKLIKICRTIAALGDDGELFDRLTGDRFADEADNKKIRWILEDDLRELLWKNGDYKSKAFRGGK